MSKISIVYCLLVMALTLAVQGKANSAVMVGFVSPESRHFFEKTVKPYWQKLEAGSAVELVSLTPFNSKGEIDLNLLASRIENAPKTMKSIYIHWNEKYDPQHRNWLAALRKKTQEGVKVAFFAGMSKPGSKTIPLRRTLASQVPKALVLGELLDRERLPALHYYGPELFSAFHNKSQKRVTGLAPLNFVSRWALQKNAKEYGRQLMNY